MDGLKRYKGLEAPLRRLAKRPVLCIALALLVCCLTAAVCRAESTVPVKAAVFNFGVRNLEASGYGTTVTNTLLVNLKNRPGFSVLDRKELENFLTLNDLQQDEDLDNVVLIGTRLGLNVIVTGSVERNGTMLAIRCKVIQVEQRKPILDVRLTAFGDAGLSRELGNLGDMIAGSVTEAKQGAEGAPTVRGPVNVQKKSGNMKIYLSWESPGGASGIAGWEVFRAFSPAGPFARIAQVNRSEYWDQAVERNRTYHYKIRSFGSRGGYSEFSGVVAAESAPTPNPPVILRTDSRVRGVQLTWLPSPAACDDPLKFKGYKLYRAKEEDGPYREVRDVAGRDAGEGEGGTGPGKVVFVDTGLGDGERYHYRVTAYNEKGLESDFSRALAGSSLPRVSDLRAAGEKIREIPLSWKPVESPFIVGYHLYRSTNPQGTFARIQRIPADARGADGRITVVDTEGLGDKQTWYYRVTAFEDADIETTPSETVSAVTRGKPPAPQGLRAEGGQVKRILLTWQASPQEEVQGYRVYRSQKKEGPFEPVGKISGRSSNRLVDDGGVPGDSTAYAERALGLAGLRGSLADGTAYFYRITSFNRVDVESDPTEIVTAETKAGPKPPSGLQAEAFRVRSIPLKWQANPEKDVTTYRVLRSDGATSEFRQVTAVQNRTEYTDLDLKDGTAYRYRIQAEDRDGLLSEPSSPVAAQTKSRPKAPAGFRGEATDSRALLSWQANTEPDIDHYDLYERGLFGLEKIATVSGASREIEGFAKGKSRVFSIRAVDRSGLESESSPEITVTAK